MNVHLRFDSSNVAHSRLTLFIAGKNCGQLCMSPDEADWFYFALERGCRELSPPGAVPIEFRGSGHHREGHPINPPPA